MVALLVIAAFRPYVAPGVRTEHLMVFAAAGVLVLMGRMPSVWRPAHFGEGEAGLWTLTAGRYGAEAAVNTIEESVLRESPLVGFGATNSAGPLDTGYVEILARAGILGLVLAGAIALILVALWLSGRQSMSRAQWWTAGALLVVWLGAATGGPTITQNRAGTILLLNLVLMLSTAARGSGQAAVAETAPPGGVVTPRLRQRSRRRSGT